MALNAVRVVAQVCDRLRDERWPPEVAACLTTQRERLEQIENDLLEARGQVAQAQSSPSYH